MLKRIPLNSKRWASEILKSLEKKHEIPQYKIDNLLKDYNIRFIVNNLKEIIKRIYINQHHAKKEN